MHSNHYSGVTGNENADFTRCAARKAMNMHECMGQKCLFVSQPKLLPIDFRGSYVLSFFAGAMALIANAYSLMSVNRANNSIAFAKKLNIQIDLPLASVNSIHCFDMEVSQYLSTHADFQCSVFGLSN